MKYSNLYSINDIVRVSFYFKYLNINMHQCIKGEEFTHSPRKFLGESNI